MCISDLVAYWLVPGRWGPFTRWPGPRLHRRFVAFALGQRPQASQLAPLDDRRPTRPGKPTGAGSLIPVPQHDHDGISPAVKDDRESRRFVVESEGSVAELVYEIDGDRMVILHAGVPSELGGRGIGGLLVGAAVERAAEEGLTVVPLCPFTRRWLHENPEMARSVSIDWGPVRKLTT